MKYMLPTFNVFSVRSTRRDVWKHTNPRERRAASSHFCKKVSSSRWFHRTVDSRPFHISPGCIAPGSCFSRKSRTSRLVSLGRSLCMRTCSIFPQRHKHQHQLNNDMLPISYLWSIWIWQEHSEFTFSRKTGNGQYAPVSGGCLNADFEEPSVSWCPDPHSMMMEHHAIFANHTCWCACTAPG
ncbi:hypothetical protein VTO42DRAFT_52 [Malbranchea cinnamomea]